MITGKIKNKKISQGNDPGHLITIIIPVLNGASTIGDALISLERQNNKDLIKEIIFINDCSADESRKIIEKYQEKSSYRTTLINNSNRDGLAKNYNKGIRACSSDYFILMHQDILLSGDGCFKEIIAPFLDSEMVMVFSGLLHPLPVWEEYNFWQKCLLSRFVGKVILNPTGKFDCYDGRKLIERVGFFDEKTFRTAGEDGDMKRRIEKSGLRASYSGFNVVHLHNKEESFSYREIFKKEAQLAEAQGVLLRLYGPDNVKDFFMSFFRQILLVLLFVPGVNTLSSSLVIIYIFFYTRLVYLNEYRNPRILILPFINFFILPIATFFSIKGFFLKTQQYSTT